MKVGENDQNTDPSQSPLATSLDYLNMILIVFVIFLLQILMMECLKLREVKQMKHHQKNYSTPGNRQKIVKVIRLVLGLHLKFYQHGYFVVL